MFVRCLKKSVRSSCPSFWPKGAENIANFEMPDLDAFDAVWAYPYWFAPFLRRYHQPKLISGMDCATLLYWRKLRVASILRPARFLRIAAGLFANALFELFYLRNRDVHVVGVDDARLLRWIMARPRFIPHPLLAYAKEFRPTRPIDRPLTFLLSSAGDPIYGSSRFLDWLRDLYIVTKNEASVRLILHKASPDAMRAIDALGMINANVKVESVTWVENYPALLQEIDIQLFPLDVGAGTKTSVLTALQHGVRAVCTPIAAENVQANLFLFLVSDLGSDFSTSLNQAITSVRQADLRIEAPDLSAHSPDACSKKFWSYLEENCQQSRYRLS